MENTIDDIGGLDGLKDQMFVRAARLAMQEGEYGQAEAACNDALALDATSVEVLLLKADAITRQSRPQADRTPEVIDCCAAAMACADTDNEQAMRVTATQRVKQALMFHTGFVCKRFALVGGQSNGDAVRQLPAFVREHALEWENLSGVGLLDDGTKRRVSAAMQDAACTAWSSCLLPAYKNHEVRSKKELNEFVASGDQCIAILEAAIALSPSDSNGNLVRYERLIGIMGKLANARAMLSIGYWTRSLPATEKAQRHKTIDSWYHEMERIDPADTRGLLQKARHDAGGIIRAEGASGGFLAVSAIVFVGNIMLLVAGLVLLADWVPSMIGGNLLSALFGVASIASGLSLVHCTMDVLDETPSRQTGRYLMLCAVALLGLALMGWWNPDTQPPCGVLAAVDGMAGLYYLMRGKYA